MGSSAGYIAQIKIFQHLDDYRGESSFLTWVHTILIRTIADFYRKKSRLILVEDLPDFPQLSQLCERLDDPYSALEMRDILQFIWYRLTTREQQIFDLAILQGHTVAECARATGMSRHHVKQALLAVKPLYLKATR